MRIKRITVRVSPELHKRVSRAAAERHLSLNQLVAEALETYVHRLDMVSGKWPLRELSALLAPAAEASGLSEEELLRHVREVRRRIWEERYRAATVAVQNKTS